MCYFASGYVLRKQKFKLNYYQACSRLQSYMVQGFAVQSMILYHKKNQHHTQTPFPKDANPKR
jgi:hypothetical protein